MFPLPQSNALIPPAYFRAAVHVLGAFVLALTVASCGGRDGPTDPETVASVLVTPDTATLVVGTTRQLTGSALDASGHPLAGRRMVWTSSSSVVAAVDSLGLVKALSPGVATITASSEGQRQTARVQVVARAGGYTEEELAYFAEIAFGFEFGNASHVIREWRNDLLIAVRGAPTDEDRATLAAVVRELNVLIGGPVRLVDAGSALPNVEIHFVPRSLFPVVLPGAPPGNAGLFYVSWDASQHFVRATVLIATDIRAPFRQHLIREELTQSLGLARDSPRYPSSIFYGGYSETHQFSKLDEALIEMLYREDVRAGMTELEARAVLAALQRRSYAGPVSAQRQSRRAVQQPSPGPVVGVGGGSGGRFGR